jgi:hypothetical protein
MESVDKICADQSGRIVQGDAESSEVTQEPQRKIVALQKVVFTAWARYTLDVLSSDTFMRWNNKGIKDYEDDEDAENQF